MYCIFCLTRFTLTGLSTYSLPTCIFPLRNVYIYRDYSYLDGSMFTVLHQKITLLSFYQTVIDMYVRLGRVEKKCSLGTKPKCLASGRI